MTAMARAAATITGRLAEVPVTPDAQEARDLVTNELAKKEYQSAKPTWFDYLASAIRDWFESLNVESLGGPSGLGLLIVAATVVTVTVIAFLIFGRPRINQRSANNRTLFGESDQRTARAMRAAAELAAQRGDFALAIMELFRSIAQSLAERGVLTVSPGTTARDFGVRASESFPSHAAAISLAATTFDDVRYLGRRGAEDEYRLMVALELALR